MISGGAAPSSAPVMICPQLNTSPLISVVTMPTVSASSSRAIRATTGAAPEPKYSLRGDDLRASRDLLDGLIKIESSSRRGDRLSLAALGPRVLRVEVLRPEERKAPLRLASLNSEFGAVSDGGEPRWDGQNLHAFSGTYGDYLLGKVSKVFPQLRREVLTEQTR